ncbi:MAG: acyloxyacyl hydrolase [Luteolibacter sp.]
MFFLSLGSLHASSDVEAPWAGNSIDVESGGLWEVGNNTPINYALMPTQLTWRSPYVFKFDLSGGSTVVVRNQVSLIGTWIARGPEDYYFGVSGAPSLEWWSPNNKWSLYLSVGGGVGFTNSTYVTGGMGQDFTLNWFAKTGVRYQIQRDFAIFGGPMFQHMSNGGATDPNPGIDALGFTVGASFSF